MEKVNKQIFNVGGGNDVSASLMELTEFCREVTGNKISIHKEPETRKADVRIYITDNSKVTKATGWKPTISVKKNISDIYRWIKENEKQLEKILN